ncbi:MAG: carbohydrate ABC transporter permease [Christensenellaceae bacterium]|nr:carbohydrate ABC transporter permease [Christensenellaceae bacterium]
MKKESILGKIVECVFLAFLFLLFVFPFYWMLITSLKTTLEAVQFPPTLWPSKLIFANYADAWKAAGFVKYGKNTIIITFAAVALQLIASVPAAFAFARMNFRGKKLFFTIILSDMMIPIQAIFIPIFLMYSRLGWLNTYRSMIIPFIYSGYSIFFMHNAFMQVSNEVLEAARLDGSSELAVMFKVIMPMIKPVIITLALLCFVRRWNDYFWNTVLTTNDTVRTLPIAINAITEAKDELLRRWDVSMAGNVMLMAPLLILYTVASKRIKSAFVYSGIK